MTAGVPILACRELRKRYGDRIAVDGISLDVLPGQAFGLLGPNGAGKTTTIKMICGLLEADSGEVLIGGKRVERGSIESRKLLGYVPQDIALYLDLNAIENLEFWGRLQGLRGSALRDKIAHVLEVVQLTDRARDRVGEYSSGMQRRLNLAVALLADPRLLVLDEPTVGVDPQSRGAILERLDELRAMGLAILVASHYIEEIERFCDQVGIIDHGVLITHGSPNALIADLGGAQRIEVRVEGNVGAFMQRSFEIPGVSEVQFVNGAVQLVTDSASAALPRILDVATSLCVEVESIEIGSANLEAVFLHVTGRSMRD